VELRNPVTAVSEAEVTGETARIFAEVRETMGLPLITSIWRILTDIEDALPTSWAAVKPLYETGKPAAALGLLMSNATLPIPETEPRGIPVEDLPAVRTIIDAYNRSNGLNLIALSTLSVEPTGPPITEAEAAAPHWPGLRRLLPADEIDAETWASLKRVDSFGNLPGRPGVATLWRHLAHWPEFLKAIEEGMAPLQQDDTIDRSITALRTSAREYAARLTRSRPDTSRIPEPATKLIERYVGEPGVARMVTLGHALRSWLV